MLNQSLTDPELIEAILQNDEKAFNLLFERYWSRVYTIAYRYVKDEEACLEITHDIFLNIWNKRHQLRINSFKNYVITAASYHGIRKKQTLRSVPIQYVEDYEYTEDEAYTFNNFSAINQGETKIWQSEFDLKVDALLNELPKRCREIYTMSRKDNLSINEISTRLNISKRTVENQLTNALKHLRTSLKCLMVIILLVGI